MATKTSPSVSVPWTQQYDRLDDRQKEILREYYNLLVNPPSTIDAEVEQITEIWSKAEDDPQLIKFLELLDYFCTNIPEVDASADNDRRAYIDEHIEDIIEQIIDSLANRDKLCSRCQEKIEKHKIVDFDRNSILKN